MVVARISDRYRFRTSDRHMKRNKNQSKKRVDVSLETWVRLHQLRFSLAPDRMLTMGETVAELVKKYDKVKGPP